MSDNRAYWKFRMNPGVDSFQSCAVCPFLVSFGNCVFLTDFFLDHSSDKEKKSVDRCPLKLAFPRFLSIQDGHFKTSIMSKTKLLNEKFHETFSVRLKLNDLSCVLLHALLTFCNPKNVKRRKCFCWLKYLEHAENVKFKWKILELFSLAFVAFLGPASSGSMSVYMILFIKMSPL